MGYDWMHGGWWGMWAGLLVLIVLAAALVFAVRGAAASRSGDAGPGAPRLTPLEILQERYARGDISREEYEQKRRDLSGRGT